MNRDCGMCSDEFLSECSVPSLLIISSPNDGPCLSFEKGLHIYLCPDTPATLSGSYPRRMPLCVGLLPPAVILPLLCIKEECRTMRPLDRNSQAFTYRHYPWTTKAEPNLDFQHNRGNLCNWSSVFSCVYPCVTVDMLFEDE